MTVFSIQLDRRVTIQSPATGTDEYGAPTVGSWTTLAEVWASVRDVSGREYLAAAAVQNATVTKIYIRYMDGIKPAMRVLSDGKIYNIEAVLGQDKRTLLLMCSTGSNNG